MSKGKEIEQRINRGANKGRYPIVINKKANLKNTTKRKVRATVKVKRAETKKQSSSHECSTKNDFELLFKDVLYQWLDFNDIKHKGATKAKYQYLAEKHILPYFEKTEINDITSAMINKFIALKLKEGRLDNSGGLSPSYVKSMVVIILSVCQYALDMQLGKPSVTKINKPSCKKKELIVLTMDEQKILEKYLMEHMGAQELGILLSLHTGLRIGEICALKWEDIDFQQRILRIRATVARVKDEETLSAKTKNIIDVPKTKSSIRDIPIPNPLFLQIQKVKDTALSKYVISDKESFISPRNLEYKFQKILCQCNIRKVNYHTLRHTFATRCIEAGVDVKTLSEILGHSSVSITLDTYVHSSIELKRIQMDKLLSYSNTSES